MFIFIQLAQAETPKSIQFWFWFCTIHLGFLKKLPREKKNSKHSLKGIFLIRKSKYVLFYALGTSSTLFQGKACLLLSWHLGIYSMMPHSSAWTINHRNERKPWPSPEVSMLPDQL